MRLKLSIGLLGCISFCAISPLVGATDYPSGPLKIIATQGPGSSTDMHARLIANGLTKRLGQPVVVENIAGAAGTLGMTAGARAPADGYTLVLGNNGNIGIAPYTFKSLPYDPQRDLVPIAHLTDNWQVLVVSEKLPFNTMSGFIDYAKRNPGKLNYGSPGAGSHAHLAMELLQSMAGIKLTHIPYKTTGQISNDLLGGTLDVAMDNYIAVGPLAEQGRIKILGTTSPVALKAEPQIPPIAKSVPGYEATGWFGLFAPKQTPDAIVKRLNAEINAVMEDASVKKTMSDAGFVAVPSSPKAFAQYVRQAQEKWSGIVKKIGLQPQ